MAADLVRRKVAVLVATGGSPAVLLKCSKCGRGGHWVRRAAALERCEPGYRLARHRRHACWWRVMPRAGAFPDNGAHVAWVRR